MNGRIGILEKDIQILEGNGFHIYDQNPSENGVIVVKKKTLEVYDRIVG